jgi:hypothetical protein
MEFACEVEDNVCSVLYFETEHSKFKTSTETGVLTNKTNKPAYYNV